MKNETGKATHTPGPWHIQDNTAYPYGQLLVASAVHGAVSICYTMEKGESRAPAEYIQNARLISAAPELIEALRDAEFLLRKAGQLAGPMRDSFNRSAADARAAIAKATGSSED